MATPRVNNPKGRERELYPTQGAPFELELLLNHMANDGAVFVIGELLVFRDGLPSLVLRGPMMGGRRFCLHVEIAESFLELPADTDDSDEADGNDGDQSNSHDDRQRLEADTADGGSNSA